MVTVLSGSTTKAIEDKLPICHMLALLPYVLISDIRFMCLYEKQLRYNFFILRWKLISAMTCLFTNICLINLLPWLQSICLKRLTECHPQSWTVANWPTGDHINQWTQDKIDRPNNIFNSNMWDDCYWMPLIGSRLYLGKHLPLGHLESTSSKHGSSMARCLITDSLLMPDSWTTVPLKLMLN